jgi:glycosyltransferase involved in cell wall biosynthesis
MQTLMIITSLHEQGAQKIFTNLCVKTVQKDQVDPPVVVSIFGGYYRQQLNRSGIKVFILLENGLITSFKQCVVFTVYLLRKRKTISVINAFLPHAGMLGLLIKLLTGASFIYSIRFTPSLTFNHWREIGIKIFHFISVFFADVIICNSPFALHELKMKYPQKKIKLIHNGITSPEKPSPEMLNKIAEHYLSPAFRYKVITTCNLRDKGKDIDTLLRVADTSRTFQFVIVGGGQRLEKLKTKAGHMQLPNVIFAGHQENVWPFLTIGDIFLFLTLFEGSPNSVIEAMAVGLPVIMSDIPPLRVMFKDEHDCLFVENGNVADICSKIDEIVSDNALRATIRANAFVKIKSIFSEDRMIEEYCKTYSATKKS